VASSQLVTSEPSRDPNFLAAAASAATLSRLTRVRYLSQTVVKTVTTEGKSLRLEGESLASEAFGFYAGYYVC
jgi:hypothetical protein